MPKPRNPGYIPGNRWVICDRTGMAFRLSEMRREWTGAIVHKDEWEPRHPQDFIQGIVDDPSPKGPVRVEGEVSETEVTCGPSAKAGIAVAGCAIAGRSAGAKDSVPSFTFDNAL